MVTWIVQFKIFDHKTLRKESGFPRAELASKWKKLHNKEFNILIPYPVLLRCLNKGS